MNDSEYFEHALAEARKARCTRGHGGAVVVKDGLVIGRGYNAPPSDDPSLAQCHRDQRTSPKPKSDRTCCVHAEWRAIIDALRSGHSLLGANLYYASAHEDGTLRRSGKPYCTVCSRLALDVGIARFGLWHEEGITMYDTKTYNELSYNYHDRANKL